jgi:hypothetical protein
VSAFHVSEPWYRKSANQLSLLFIHRIRRYIFLIAYSSFLFPNHSIRTAMVLFCPYTPLTYSAMGAYEYEFRPRSPQTPQLPLQCVEQYYTCTIITQPRAPRIKNIAIRIYIPSTAAPTPTPSSRDHTLDLLHAFNGRLCPHTHTRPLLSIKSLYPRSLRRKIREMFTPDQGDTLTTTCKLWRCGARISTTPSVAGLRISVDLWPKHELDSDQWHWLSEVKMRAERFWEGGFQYVREG